MSIIVKNMQMPKDCRECRLMEYHINLGETLCAPVIGLLAVNFEPIHFDGRPDWCPLVELPEHHGDLIDRQKLLEDNKHLEYPTDGKYRRDRAWAVGFNAGAKHCNEHAVYAKTIIEAEGVDE